jgi:hypothetical protein
MNSGSIKFHELELTPVRRYHVEGEKQDCGNESMFITHIITINTRSYCLFLFTYLHDTLQP